MIAYDLKTNKANTNNKLNSNFDLLQPNNFPLCFSPF